MNSGFIPFEIKLKCNRLSQEGEAILWFDCENSHRLIGSFPSHIARSASDRCGGINVHQLVSSDDHNPLLNLSIIVGERTTFNRQHHYLFLLARYPIRAEKGKGPLNYGLVLLSGSFHAVV